MKAFLQKINGLINLQENEISDLQKICTIKSFNKGDQILRINQINRHLYFINSGLVKLSFFKEDKEFIMRFFCEGQFCAALDSFITQKPSDYFITEIEDIELIQIDFESFNKLARKHHSIEHIFRLITSMATVNMMNRISEMLENNGTEAYAKFLKENKHIVNRVSLGDLSGYLGITQVSLSRIRGKK